MDLNLKNKIPQEVNFQKSRQRGFHLLINAGNHEFFAFIFNLISEYIEHAHVCRCLQLLFTNLEPYLKFAPQVSILLNDLRFKSSKSELMSKYHSKDLISQLLTMSRQMHPKNEIQLEEYFSLSEKYNCRILIIDELDYETSINRYRFDCPASVNIKKLKTSDQISYLILYKADDENEHFCCKAKSLKDDEERLFDIGQGLFKLTSKKKGLKNVKDVINKLEKDLNCRQKEILINIAEKVHKNQSQGIVPIQKKNLIENSSVSSEPRFVCEDSPLNKDYSSPLNSNGFDSVPKNSYIVDYYELVKNEADESINLPEVQNNEIKLVKNDKLSINFKMILPSKGKTGISSANLMFSSIKIPPFIPKIKDLNLENPAYKLVAVPKAQLAIPSIPPIKIQPKKIDMNIDFGFQKSSIKDEPNKFVPRSSTRIDKSQIKLLNENEKKMKIEDYNRRLSQNFLKPVAKTQSTKNNFVEKEEHVELIGEGLNNKKGFIEEFNENKPLNPFEVFEEKKIFPLNVENIEKIVESPQVEISDFKVKPNESSPIKIEEKKIEAFKSMPRDIEENKVKAYVNIPEKPLESKVNIIENPPIKVQETKGEKLLATNIKIPPPPQVPKEFFTIPSLNFETSPQKPIGKESETKKFINPNLPCPPSNKLEKNPISLSIYFENSSSIDSNVPYSNNHASYLSEAPRNYNNMQPPPFNQNMPITTSLEFQQNAMPYPLNANPTPNINNGIAPPLPLISGMPNLQSLPSYINELQTPNLGTNVPILNSFPANNYNSPPPLNSISSNQSNPPPLDNSTPYISSFPDNHSSIPPPLILPNSSIPSVPNNHSSMPPPLILPNSLIPSVPDNHSSIPPPLILPNSSIPSVPDNHSSIPPPLILPNSLIPSVPDNHSSIPPPLNINLPINSGPSIKNSLPSHSIVPSLQNDPNSLISTPKSSTKLKNLIDEGSENLPKLEIQNTTNVKANLLFPNNPKVSEIKPQISNTKPSFLDFQKPFESKKPSSSANELFGKSSKGIEENLPKGPISKLKPQEVIKPSNIEPPPIPSLPPFQNQDKKFPSANQPIINQKNKEPYKQISMHPDLPPYNLKPEEALKPNYMELPPFPNSPPTKFEEKILPSVNNPITDQKARESYRPLSMHPDLPPWPGNGHLSTPIKKNNLLPDIPILYQVAYSKPEQKSSYSKFPDKINPAGVPLLPDDSSSGSESEISSSSSSSSSRAPITIIEENKELVRVQEKSIGKFIVEEENLQIIVSDNKKNTSNKSSMPYNETMCITCLENFNDQDPRLKCGCINCLNCLGESSLLKKCVKCGVELDVGDIQLLKVYFP